MVYGSHVILSAYGFWLPNDPRGSWSDFVRSWELTRFGEATKVETHRSVAAKPHDWRLRQAAKLSLKYPAVVFNEAQIQSVADGFAKYVERSGVTIWACAILPEHVHLVVARHSYKVETIMTQLKGNATQRLNHDGLYPLASYAKGVKIPKAWADDGWKVFLDSEADIVRAVRYVEENPEKENRPKQTWEFVKPFTGL